MNIRKVLAILLVGTIAFASLLGVAAYTIARAQEGTPSPTPEATTPEATTPESSTPEGATVEKEFRHGHGLPGGVDDEQLATALGITVDELNTAYETAFNAGLDQAVAQGLITKAQADELRSRGAAFPFGGRWTGWLSNNGIDYNALLANALGITVEQLQAAKAQAYNANIDQAVTDGLLTQEQADLMKGQYALRNNETFQSSMRSAFESAVNQAVAGGVITQAQADAILSRMNETGNRGWFGGLDLGGKDIFGGPGIFGGRGGRGGGGHFEFRLLPDGEAPDVSPEETLPGGTSG